jgi:hypothetical protein
MTAEKLASNMAGKYFLTYRCQVNLEGTIDNMNLCLGLSLVDFLSEE